MTDGSCEKLFLLRLPTGGLAIQLPLGKAIGRHPCPIPRSIINGGAHLPERRDCIVAPLGLTAELRRWKDALNGRETHFPFLPTSGQGSRLFHGYPQAGLPYPSVLLILSAYQAKSLAQFRFTNALWHRCRQPIRICSPPHRSPFLHT